MGSHVLQRSIKRFVNEIRYKINIYIIYLFYTHIALILL